MRRLFSVLALLSVLAASALLGDPAGGAPPPAHLDAMSIDMDTAGNAADVVGPSEFCARLDENDLLDADEAAVDTLDLDVTVGPVGIPSSNPLLAYQFTLVYPRGVLAVTGEGQDYLLTDKKGSVLFSVSEPLPDTDGEFTGAAADVSRLDYPFAMTFETGPGVLSRVSASSQPGAVAGVYDLILYASGYVDTDNNAFPPAAYNQAVAALGTACPAVQPPPKPAPAPENDDFANATVIESLPYYDWNTGYDETTESAGTEPGEPLPCGDMGATIWYEYTPRKNGPFRVVASSSFHAALGIYAAGADSLDPIDCLAQPVHDSAASVIGNGGRTYYFQAGGTAGATGRFRISVEPEGIAGDADCDGTITAEDAWMALRSVAESRFHDDCLGLGDVDCAGGISAADALYVLRFVAGLTTRLPLHCGYRASAR